LACSEEYEGGYAGGKPKFFVHKISFVYGQFPVEKFREIIPEMRLRNGLAPAVRRMSVY
jgi:hypothetical protein